MPTINVNQFIDNLKAARSLPSPYNPLSCEEAEKQLTDGAVYLLQHVFSPLIAESKEITTEDIDMDAFDQEEIRDVVSYLNDVFYGDEAKRYETFYRVFQDSSPQTASILFI
mgnify:CR=1 FL=1